MIGFAHFLVDFACGLLVARLGQGNMVPLLLLYNFCAFALELPLGVWLEGRFHPLKIAVVGMGLVTFSQLGQSLPWASVFVAGAGNALFHLGGGLQVMTSRDTMTPLGVFIAPGALGIYFGAFAPAWLWIPTVASLGLVGLWLWKEPENQKVCAAQKKTGQMSVWTGIAVVALFLMVVLRGFAGAASFPWKAQWAGLLVAMVVLGKVLGGILADRFGANLVGFSSLVVTGLCFLAPQSPCFGLLGMLAFQMTMPITLWQLACVLPKAVAFGLLTMGLFVGSLPVILHIPVEVHLPSLILLSLALFFLGRKKEGAI